MKNECCHTVVANMAQTMRWHLVIRKIMYCQPLFNKGGLQLRPMRGKKQQRAVVSKQEKWEGGGGFWGCVAFTRGKTKKMRRSAY